MSPTKKFLLLYFGFALVVWIAGSYLMGPPSMSQDYLGEGTTKADHDRYLEITKSAPYQKYEQRPKLHGPGTEGAPTNLQAQINFMEDYINRPAYKAEDARVKRYYLFFECFNFLLVLVLIIRFARKPLLNFLDGKISELRDTLLIAESERSTAQARKQAADGKLAELPEEQQALKAQTEKELARQLAELEEANQHSLAVMRLEMEDRKKEETRLAALLVKQELINEATDKLTEDFKVGQSSAKQSALVAQFLTEMEKRV